MKNHHEYELKDNKKAKYMVIFPLLNFKTFESCPKHLCSHTDWSQMTGFRDNTPFLAKYGSTFFLGGLHLSVTSALQSAHIDLEEIPYSSRPFFLMRCSVPAFIWHFSLEQKLRTNPNLNQYTASWYSSFLTRLPLDQRKEKCHIRCWFNHT